MRIPSEFAKLRATYLESVRKTFAPQKEWASYTGVVPLGPVLIAITTLESRTRDTPIKINCKVEHWDPNEPTHGGQPLTLMAIAHELPSLQRWTLRALRVLTLPIADPWDRVQNIRIAPPPPPLHFIADKFRTIHTDGYRPWEVRNALEQ